MQLILCLCEGERPRTRARPPRHRLRRLGQLTNTLTCPWKPGGAAMHWQGVCATRPPPAITPPGRGSQMYWALYPASTLEYSIERSRQGARGRPLEQTRCMNLTTGACRELATGRAEVLYPPSLHSGGTGMVSAPRVMAHVRCARPRAAPLFLAVHAPE